MKISEWPWKQTSFPCCKGNYYPQVSGQFFPLYIYMCSCSEIDMDFSNKYGKNLDLKVLNYIMPGLPKCFLSFRDVL